MDFDTILGIFFVFIILSGGILILFNLDKLFDNTVILEYGDGCNETYKRGELVSPICENGRELSYGNYNGLNLTQVQGLGDIDKFDNIVVENATVEYKDNIVSWNGTVDDVPQVNNVTFQPNITNGTTKSN